MRLVITEATLLLLPAAADLAVRNTDPDGVDLPVLCVFERAESDAEPREVDRADPIELLRAESNCPIKANARLVLKLTLLAERRTDPERKDR